MKDDDKNINIKIENKKNKRNRNMRSSGPFGGAYFLMIIGAAVYFVQRVDGFWPIVLAILKALVWPAFLVHRAFELMNI